MDLYNTEDIAQTNTILYILSVLQKKLLMQNLQN